MGRGRARLWRLDCGDRRGDRPLRDQPRSAPSSTRSRRTSRASTTSPARCIALRRWDHDYDLDGKRVAVIGTGRQRGAARSRRSRATAGAARRLPAARRSGSFAEARPEDPGAGSQTLFAPRARCAARRARSSPRRSSRSLLVGMVVTTASASRPRARSRSAPATGASCSRVKDPELRRKLTPDYGLGCKRPSVSNRYLRTFNRDNVELVTDPIERVTPAGIRTADGASGEIDVLVLATGFRIAIRPRELPPHAGARARRLRPRDPLRARTALQSYEGVSMPGLPNHFMIFGPYGWTGASWHVLVETSRAPHHPRDRARPRGAAPRRSRSGPRRTTASLASSRSGCRTRSAPQPQLRDRQHLLLRPSRRRAAAAPDELAAGAAREPAVPARRLRLCER